MCGHTCGHVCVPPTVTGPAPAKCTHPNRVRQAPHRDEFELVSIDDGLGRFDTIPMMGVLDQWEQDRLLVNGHANQVLATLAVQSSCYSYEQVLFCNVIACMLEIFDIHGPKMLRNRKKIGGSYYYNICEMIREPDNIAAAATYMMTVSLGKRPEMLASENPWHPAERMKPSLLSLWNLFHDTMALNDEELEETIESWTRTAKEWSLAMIYLKMAHKRLSQESPLYLTADIFNSKEDDNRVQEYVRECLRAGDDRYALANPSLTRLRQEVLCIHRRIDNKLNNSSPQTLKKMTPYDIDLLRFYTTTLGQLCTTGNVVSALMAWRDQRHEGMKKLRALALERKCRDLTMQVLADGTDGSKQKQPDSELSSISSGSNFSNRSRVIALSECETLS